MIFTRAWATSASTNTAPSSQPAWLVIPALLDVQPVVLRMDVRREATAQLRHFCHAHGLDRSICSDGLRQAIKDVVDLEHVCRSSEQTLASPAFVAAKHVIRPRSGDGGNEPVPSFSWLQDSADHIAMDLCRFAQLPSPDFTLKCSTALEIAIQRSFNWIRSLPFCDTLASQREISVARAHRHDRDTIAEVTVNVSVVELMIASEQHQEADTTNQQRERDGDAVDVHDVTAKAPASERVQASATESTDLDVSKSSSQGLTTPIAKSDSGTAGEDIKPPFGAEAEQTAPENSRGLVGRDDDVMVVVTASQNEPVTNDGSGQPQHDTVSSAQDPRNLDGERLPGRTAAEAHSVTAGDSDRAISSVMTAVQDSSPSPLNNVEATPMRLPEMLMLSGGPEAAPELLRVLSTLAMLLFIVYLVLGTFAAAIRSVANSEIVHKLDQRVRVALAEAVSLLTRRLSSVRASASVAPTSRPSLDTFTGGVKPSEEEDWHCIERPRASPLRLCAVAHASVQLQRRSREALRRRAQAVKKAVKAHDQRTLCVAFRVWRLSALPVEPTVCRESTTATESKPAAPPSFACAALALMFASHGTYYHRVRSGGSAARAAEAQLIPALAVLMENDSQHERSGNVTVGGRLAELFAARRIQSTWRRHRRRSGLSIVTATSALPVKANEPLTPLFAILRKKQGARQASIGACFGLPAFQGVLPPAASVNLPPCS